MTMKQAVRAIDEFKQATMLMQVHSHGVFFLTASLMSWYGMLCSVKYIPIESILNADQEQATVAAPWASVLRGLNLLIDF